MSNVDTLLAAEETLGAVVREMAGEYKQNGKTWTRSWMQKHVNDRATLIRARAILLDRAEAAVGGLGIFPSCSPVETNRSVSPEAGKPEVIGRAHGYTQRGTAPTDQSASRYTHPPREGGSAPEARVGYNNDSATNG